MGYGHRRETVDSRLHLLEDLARGHPQTWTTERDPAVTRKLSNQIREALYIAHKYHPDAYPGLASAYEMFSIHIVEDGRIEARFKNLAHVTVDRGGFGTQTPTHGVVTPALGFKTVPQVALTTATECIESWQRHLPSSDSVQLLRTNLDYAELLKLHAFCECNTPSLMLLVGEDHITMSLYEAEVAAIAAWQPEAIPEPEEEFDV